MVVLSSKTSSMARPWWFKGILTSSRIKGSLVPTLFLTKILKLCVLAASKCKSNNLGSCETPNVDQFPWFCSTSMMYCKSFVIVTSLLGILTTPEPLARKSKSLLVNVVVITLPSILISSNCTSPWTIKVSSVAEVACLRFFEGYLFSQLRLVRFQGHFKSLTLCQFPYYPILHGIYSSQSFPTLTKSSYSTSSYTLLQSSCGSSCS